MPIVPIGKPKSSIYIFDTTRKLPVHWTDSACYDFLDHMLFLAEQKTAPYYISLCCGLDKMIEKQPYDYNGVRQWICRHPDFARKIWSTICIPVNNMVVSE